MTHGKGIPMPKKREKVGSPPFDELSTVKIVGSDVLVLHSVSAKENTVYDNVNWRMRTFESFRRRVSNVAEEYVGGIDEESILINDPIICSVEENEQDPDDYKKVIVNFSAIIPHIIDRKEIN
tara:strand:- start:72 stop:440 length:369 start_codon:yes stop_codon:yes gene_type:complete